MSPARLLCFLSFHRWTLTSVIDGRLAQILFSYAGPKHWQEVCARKGCRAVRPVQQQTKQSLKGPSQ